MDDFYFDCFQKEKENRAKEEEEQKIISDSLAKSVDEELEKAEEDSNESVYFRRYVNLKKYIKKSESKFVELEQKHLKSITQIYNLLTSEQKLRLIRKFEFFVLYF